MAMIKGDMKMLFIIFIGVTLAVSFLIAISNDTNSQTVLSFADNESQSIASARYGANNINESITFSVANDQSTTGKSPISSFVMRGPDGTELTLTTDYTVDLDAGTFNLVNNTYWVGEGENTSYVDYNYKGPSYVDNEGARSFTSVILILSALAALLFVIGILLSRGGMMRKLLGM